MVAMQNAGAAKPIEIRCSCRSSRHCCQAMAIGELPRRRKTFSTSHPGAFDLKVDNAPYFRPTLRVLILLYIKGSARSLDDIRESIKQVRAALTQYRDGLAYQSTQAVGAQENVKCQGRVV